jgi:hypothetical protein
MSHLESIASSAVSSRSIKFKIDGTYIWCLISCGIHVQVRAAVKVKASVIVVFTSSGRAAR